MGETPFPDPIIADGMSVWKGRVGKKSVYGVAQAASAHQT